MASIRTTSRSPYWIARIRAWVAAPEHPRAGFWRATDRSTKVPQTKARKTAQRVADEMERIAGELAHVAPDRMFWEDRLAALMRAAGVERPVARTTWAKAASDWLAAKDVAARSIERYESDLEHFRRFLGARAGHDLRTISPEDVSAFYQGLLKVVSATTARHVTKTIRSALQRAHVLRFIESNPAALLRMSGGPESSRQPFSREDVAALMAFLDAGDLAEWRTACLFGLYYGLRVQDAVSRSFSEIKTVDGVRVIMFTPMKKARRGRTITLPLVGELSLLDGKGFITPTLARRRKLASKDFSALLERSPIERGVSRRGGARRQSAKSFHSFRHTAASWMVDAGVDQRVRQLVCDHDDAKVASRYTHASLGTMADAVKKACRLA